jgi:hypothetical protein
VPEACLHRISHTVGTYLVGESKILKAAGRQRYRNPSTTLCNYADALPPDDEDVADALAHLYRDPSDPPRAHRTRPWDPCSPCHGVLRLQTVNGQVGLLMVMGGPGDGRRGAGWSE